MAITHFAPSLRSADPRFGSQSGTASFCNADDELLPLADLWLTLLRTFGVERERFADSTGTLKELVG